MYKFTNQPVLVTMTVRLSGQISEAEMASALREAKRACDDYRGQPHLFLADMRGMRPASGEVANLMYEGIAYLRKRGTVCCVHLSDSAVARLQAARIAREATVGEEVTVEVVSLDEAELVLREWRAKLGAMPR